MTERNDFLRYTQRQASLVPGTNGSTLRGYSAGAYGAFKPHTINGLAVALLAATSTLVLIDLGGQQIPGKNRIELWFLSSSPLLINPILANFSGGAYQVSNAELFGFLDSNLGVPLKVRTVAKAV